MEQFMISVSKHRSSGYLASSLSSWFTAEESNELFDSLKQVFDAYVEAHPNLEGK